jgi:hypothetical protein
MQHADAVPYGDRGAFDLDPAAVKKDGPFVSHEKPGGDFHQRAFSGAVFAQDAVNGSRAKQQGHVRTGLYFAETLVNIPKLKIHTFHLSVDKQQGT